MTDTDEAQRKRSEAARKANATKRREGRRQAALKAMATRGMEVVARGCAQGRRGTPAQP